MRARRTSTISAVIAAGVHLFPFRTEKLSPPAPMVLGGKPPGRVGRRRITCTTKAPWLRGFSRSSLGPPPRSGRRYQQKCQLGSAKSRCPKPSPSFWRISSATRARSNRCEYVLSVIAGSECPSWRATLTGSSLSPTLSIDANVCRKVCGVTSSRPAFETARSPPRAATLCRSPRPSVPGRGSHSAATRAAPAGAPLAPWRAAGRG
jgi:hypothetical protein